MLFQKLQTWQDEKGVSNTELARKIGVDPTAISRAKRGLRVLGMQHQLAIQRFTKAVSPADWAEFYAQTVTIRAKAAQKKSADLVEGAA